MFQHFVEGIRTRGSDIPNLACLVELVSILTAKKRNYHPHYAAIFVEYIRKNEEMLLSSSEYVAVNTDLLKNNFFLFYAFFVGKTFMRNFGLYLTKSKAKVGQHPAAELLHVFFFFCIK